MRRSSKPSQSKLECVSVCSIPRERNRPPLTVYWTPGSNPSAALVVYFHGGGLFQCPPIRWPSPQWKLCADSARSGRVCVAVDYCLSAFPWEIPIAGVMVIFALLALSSNLRTEGVGLSACGAGRLSLAQLGCYFVACLAGVMVVGCTPLCFRAASHPAHLLEAALALEWCSAHASQFGADGGQIVAIGESSGGQLALLLAAGHVPCSVRLAGVIAVSAPFDYRTEALARLHPCVRAAVRRILLRGPFGSDPAAWNMVSPMQHLEMGHLKDVPLLIAFPRSEFFGISFVEKQFDALLCPKLAASTARREGAIVFEEVLDSQLHFSAVGSLKPCLSDDQGFWTAVKNRALQQEEVAK